MERAEMLNQFKAKLESLRIPHEELNVFGAIRINVHVRCIGRDTAHKWGDVLAQVFKAKVSIVESMWDAKENKGTCLRPTKRQGFLVSIAA